ncbi:hypothetical protein [Microbacterium sp. E-13]|uniref:hypothetical protein n=1 Tax=Microbacterium sp. E-13 TaxID=3404048 RepID=UPI003CFABCE2
MNAEAVTQDRPTIPGVLALALSTGAVLSLWLYNALWVGNAGNPAALDAAENVAMLTWMVGWLLVVCAAGAAAVLLVSVIRRIATRVLPLIDIVALGGSTALIVVAVSLAPLWGTGYA